MNAAVMHVTAFSDDHRQAVIDLWRDCDLVVSWNDPNKDIDRKLQVSPDLFLVGVADGAVVATVMAGYEGHRGWLNYLAVSPAHQGKGLGRQIVDEAEKRLLALGCPKVNLQVRETNTVAVAFYQELGYQVDNVIGLGKRLVADE